MVPSWTHRFTAQWGNGVELPALRAEGAIRPANILYNLASLILIGEGGV
jgi:hypothetical protein